jgi:hypothetical protein
MDGAMSKSTNRAGTLALELTIVVAGVLIALAADSWWNARGDAQRVDRYLAALEADFVTAQTKLDATIETHEQILENTRGFLAYVQAPERPEGDVPNPLMGDDERFFPPFGTIDALLTTGDISLLPEPLRLVLIRERSVIDSRMEQASRMQDLWAASVRDIVLPVEEARFRTRVDMGDVSTIAEISRSSPQARAGWNQLSIAVANVLAEHRAMQSSVAAIVDAVRSARADRG